MLIVTGAEVFWDKTSKILCALEEIILRAQIDDLLRLSGR
jgi:hypothetical protein